MGFKTTACARAVVDLLSLPITAEAFENEVVQIYQELFPSADLMPGNKFVSYQYNRNLFLIFYWEYRR